MIRPRDLLAVGLMAMLSAAVTSLPALDRLNRLDLDVLHWLRASTPVQPKPAHPANAVLIDIDEATYATAPFAGMPTVMWTPQLARVMDSVLDSGAAVVGWDMVLPVAVGGRIADRRYDQPLLRSLARSRRDGRIVLGAAYGDNPILPHRIFNFAVGGAKNIRSLNLHTDADGIVRGVPLFVEVEKDGGITKQPGFALELTARAIGAEPSSEGEGAGIGDYVIPGGASNVLTLNFDGRPGAVPIYSFGDLFHCAEQGNVAYFKSNFAGKTVIMGAVLDLQDRRLASNRFIVSPDTVGAPEPCISSPQTSTGIAPRATLGALIYATAINNLLQRDVDDIVARGPSTAVVFFLAFIVAGLTLMLRPPRAAIVCFFVGSIWTGVTVLAFRNGFLPPLMDTVASGSLSFAGMLGYRFVASNRERNRLSKSFSLYLAPAVIERMLSGNCLPKLGGESRTLTVLFSDIAGFTEISEGLSPADLVTFLNQYLSVMSDTIEAHGGFVDKYIGDAVVAVYGAPVDDEDHALPGVRAALACQRRLGAEASGFGLPGGRSVETRIGVNSGEMLVGNIGSRRRFNYTVLGDAVNLAARLESANKQYGSKILVSDSTATLCSATIRFRALDTVRVVGRQQPVTIFEPLGELGEALNVEIGSEQLQHYASALAAYRSGDFEAAYEEFTALEGDAAALRAADRALALVNDPPDEPWDGVTNLDTK